MNHASCSAVSCQVGEALIGSATPYQTYILVECPTPWAADAFESKQIPDSLKEFVQSVKRAQLPIRFLLICQPPSPPRSGCTLIIYDQASAPRCPGYQRWEWTLDSLDQVAPWVRRYWAGHPPKSDATSSAERDLLICVHGSHDRCCGKLGMPFYRAAIATLAQQALPGVRLWQTSHIGGHRFAPTLIDLPQGRVYGRLDPTTLAPLLTKSGSIRSLQPVYRGCSLLPQALQPVELALMQHYGWPWFDCALTYRQLDPTPLPTEPGAIAASLDVHLPTGETHTYQTIVVPDLSSGGEVRLSCGGPTASLPLRYRVQVLQQCSSDRPAPVLA
jgi:hypothetical protein